MKRCSTSDDSSPNENKVSRLEQSDQQVDIQVRAAEDAVVFLMSAEDCKLSNEVLKQKLLLKHPNLRDQWGGVESFVERFNGCMKRIDGDHVQAYTSLEICDRFTARKGECHSALCPRLHVCKWHVVSNTSCPDQHRDKHRIRSRHNKRLLKAHHLGKLNCAQVKQLIRRCRNRSTLPHCCVYYCNTQGCRTQINGGQCPFLHVCCYWMQDSCRFTDSCRRSHDLHAPQPVSMLRAYGVKFEDLTNEELRVMLRDAGIGLTHKPPDPPLPPGFQQLADSDSESDSDVEHDEQSTSSDINLNKSIGGSTAFLPPDMARAEQANSRANALNVYGAMMVMRPGIALQQYLQPSLAYSPQVAPLMKTVQISSIQQTVAAGFPQMLQLPQQHVGATQLQQALQPSVNTQPLPVTSAAQLQPLSPLAAATPHGLFTLQQLQSSVGALGAQPVTPKAVSQWSPQFTSPITLQPHLPTAGFAQQVLARQASWADATPALLDPSLLTKP